MVVEGTDVVITGGGTAGHLYPALAIADALGRRGYPKESVLFVGARAGIERQILPQSGYRFELLPGRGIVRRVTFANFVAIGGLAVAFTRALVLIGRLRPLVVVAVGGYGGVACACAARVWRVPVVTVNVDSVVGAANRFIARFAERSTVGYPDVDLPRSVVTGVPVHDEIVEAHRSPDLRAEARAEMGVGASQRLVVVVGGSLGARRLNDGAIGLRKLWAAREDLVLHHICGTREYERVLHVPAPSGVLDYRLVGYEDQMARVLCAADLVVSRAGAMTVAELRAVGTPSLLVPLPGAPHDHQRRNAEFLAAIGGAVILDDTDATPEYLDRAIGELLYDVEALGEMGKNAHTGVNSDSAGAIAGVVDEVAKERRQRR